MTLYENPSRGSAIVGAQLANLGLPCGMITAGDAFDDMAALQQRNFPL